MRSPLYNLDNNNTAMVGVKSSLVNATRIICYGSLEQFTFSMKAVRQACHLPESFPLAFIYNLQLSQLPLNFFFD
jgi:hypothetical protein